MEPSANAQHLPDPAVLADAHVHIHDCFDLDSMLDCAWSNFNQAAARLGQTQAVQYLLLLTESRWANYFERLSSGEIPLQRWQVHPNSEHCSLELQRPPAHGTGESTRDAAKLTLVAGNQVVAQEGLELLTLGTAQRFEDGEPLVNSLQQATSAGAVCVIPWGFGKWMGRRGRVLEGLLANPDLPVFHLGDNSGRPWFWPRPAPFGSGIGRARRVLPGSDPLPFASEFWRAGTFGFHVPVTPDPERPMQALSQALREQPSVHAYGRQEGAVRFVRNQVAMQFRKRR